MKYLIAGLGNIGAEYTETRHNIGFKVVDALAKAAGVAFETGRYGSVAELKYKGRTFILLKPSTYMNLSGKAVGYWLKTEKIPIENLFVVVDDIALLPSNEVVRDVDAEAVDIVARAVHVEFAVGGMKYERVAECHIERITICRRVASEQDRRQEEDEQFFHTGYLNGLNPS